MPRINTVRETNGRCQTALSRELPGCIMIYLDGWPISSRWMQPGNRTLFSQLSTSQLESMEKKQKIWQTPGSWIISRMATRNKFTLWGNPVPNHHLPVWVVILLVSDLSHQSHKMLLTWQQMKLLHFRHSPLWVDQGCSVQFQHPDSLQNKVLAMSNV